MTIASSEVLVVADTSRFRQSARSGVTSAMAGEEATVPVVPDTSGFRGNVNSALRGMRPIRIGLDPQTRAVIRELQTAFRAMRPLLVPIAVRAGDLRNQIRDSIRALPPVNITVTADRRALIRSIETALSRWPWEIRVRVNLDPDLDDFERRVNARRLTIRANVEPNVNGNTLTRSLTRAFSTATTAARRFGVVLAGALAVGTAGAAISGLTVALAALVAALAPAVGLLAALPAVVLGVRAAAGALSLALYGVGDAFKAGLTEDAKKFEETLKNLSPEARAAAREVRALRPAFESLRTTVQDAFFTQFEGEITRVANALRTTLTQGLTGISTQWGRAAAAAAQYVRSAAGIRNVAGVLSGTRAAMTGLAAATQPVVRGFLDIAAAISTGFGAELGSGIEGLGQQFGAFLSSAAASGRAFAWVDNALTVLAQLGDLLGNIGSILTGFFGAAGAATGGFLTNLQNITREFAAFVNSAGAQASITAAFRTMAVIGSELGPILQAIILHLGTLTSVLTPVFQALGPAVTGALNSLAPAIAALGPGLAALGQGLAASLGSIDLVPLANALNGVLLAVAPLLPLIVELGNGVLGVLVPAVVAVTPALQGLASVLTLLGPALGPIAAGLTAVWLALSVFAGARAIVMGIQAAWLALNLAFAASPIGFVITLVIGLVAAVIYAWNNIKPFREFILGLWSGVQAAWSSAIEWISGIWDSVVSSWNSGVQAVSSAIDSVVGFFTGMWVRITGAVSSGINSVTQFFTGMWAGITGAVSAGITAVVNFFVALPGQILGFLQALPGMLVDLFTTAVAQTVLTLIAVSVNILNFFRELPGQIVSGLVGLGTAIAGAFVTAYTNVTTATVSWFNSTVEFFRQLPGRIISALVALGAMLLNSFVSAFNVATAAVARWITTTVNNFQQAPAKIGSALASLGSAIGRQFSSAFTTTTSTVSRWIDNTIRFFRELPGKIASALASLGTSLANAFANAYTSTKNAVGDLINNIVGLFRNLGSRIVGALGNIGSQIVSKIKEGLPDAVRGVLPFANGGIVTGPTRALIGEAGREVVIPMTRPWRAVQLARDSGLADLLARAGGTTNSRSTTVNAPMTVHMSSGASDNRAVADLFAQGVVRRLGML
ncbi:hypothetical protein [Streptomyces sp. NPDC088739]|uniref:hypothetical protein n=1 Tax=Streptomyces sp. NPDC088739 TaxID=3365882 RepID=UPI00381535DC